MNLFRSSLTFAALGAALSAHAGLVTIQEFDAPLEPTSVSIASGTAATYTLASDFYNYLDPTVQSNASASQTLDLDIVGGALRYRTGAAVDGALQIRFFHRTYSGPGAYLGLNLGNTLTAIHLEFGRLDQDLPLSFAGRGERSANNDVVYTYSGSAVIPAGTTSIDLPLGSSEGPITRLAALTLDFDASAGTNFDLNAVGVQAVPEPGTLATLGLGAAAVWRRRKRA